MKIKSIIVFLLTLSFLMPKNIWASNDSKVHSKTIISDTSKILPLDLDFYLSDVDSEDDDVDNIFKRNLFHLDFVSILTSYFFISSKKSSFSFHSYSKKLNSNLSKLYKSNCVFRI